MTTTRAIIQAFSRSPLILGVLFGWGCGDAVTPTGPESSAGGESQAGVQSAGQGAGQGAAQGKTPFIIVLGEKDDPAAVAQEHGIQAKHMYRKVLNGFAGDISDAARSGLLRDSRVVKVQRDQELGIAEGIQVSPPWGLDRVDQRTKDLNGSYVYESTGSGVTAYVLDTGIRFSHTDFTGRAYPGFDAFAGDGSDCNGHGTHVAGILGGVTYGVAKEVDLVSVRVLGCTGTGFTSGVIAGLEWIAADASGPSVANMSLIAGGNSALDEAVANLVGQGVSVFVAAGNDNQDACSFSPSRAPSAVTVAASGWTDVRADFSNWGSCVDLFAPGVSVISTTHASDDAAEFRSGTSMASPHVAGAAALYLSLYPDAQPSEVASVLIDGATQGAVAVANSANNHLLYSLVDGSSPPIDDGTKTNQPPLAEFTGACLELVCTFADLSVDPEGALVEWRWDYGDGTVLVSSEAPPSSGWDYAYAGPGEYTVTLRVTDDQGVSDTLSKKVTAYLLQEANLPPTADFSVACEELACTFSDLSSDLDGTLVKWEWAFGDGALEIVYDASASNSQSHSFGQSGTYSVVLTVTDDEGASDVRTQPVTVSVTPALPDIELSATGIKDKGRHVLELAWAGAQGGFVDVWLNGAVLTRTENDGALVHGTENKGKGTYLFKVCETQSDRCSVEVEVVF